MHESDGTIRLSVVIPALNAEATLRRQLDALVAQRPIDTEIVVVDNGSTDATATIVDDLAVSVPHIRLVRCARRGVNRARNAGVAAAVSDRILLCDSDDIVEPAWIAALACGLNESDLVGGAIRYSYAPDQPPFCPDGAVLFGMASPWGGCAGLRKSAWATAGGFDESMSGGGDEIDFFIRAQLLGARLSWVPDAVLVYETVRGRQNSSRREYQLELYCCSSYWFGRGLGQPRRSGLMRDLWHLCSRTPFAPLLGRVRPGLRRATVRRIARLHGALRFGVPRFRDGRRRRSAAVRSR